MHVEYYAGIAVLGLLIAIFGAIGKSSTALILGVIMVILGIYQVSTTPAGWETVQRSIFRLGT